MLPSEEKATREIESRFKNEFQTAHDQLRFGIEVHSALLDNQTSGLTDVVKCATLGLYTKACKQYRAVIALCELGLTEDAETILRTQFECMLTLQFILKPRLAFRRFGRKLPKIPASCPARDFRARLYTAYQYLKGEKLIDNMEGTPGLKRAFKKSTKRFVREDATEWATMIGSWHSVLTQKPFTYSGLSIRQLAKALGFERWYLTLYGNHHREYTRPTVWISSMWKEIRSTLGWNQIHRRFR